MYTTTKATFHNCLDTNNMEPGTYTVEQEPPTIEWDTERDRVIITYILHDPECWIAKSEKEKL